MHCFVILRHEMPERDGRTSHFDLLLEEESNARSFALDELPSEEACVHAISLEPHRLHYLDYEGEVSGGRGTVTRIDRGQYRLIQDDEEMIIVRLDGTVYHGMLAIERDRTKEGPYEHFLVSFETLERHSPAESSL